MKDLIIAVCTALTTALTAWVAVHKANQLTIFRIERLEAKVDQHNCLDRRIVALEAEVKFLREGGGKK
jgi:hypothetical protein